MPIANSTAMPMIVYIIVLAVVARTVLSSATFLAALSLAFCRSSSALTTSACSLAPSPRMRASASLLLPALARARHLVWTSSNLALAAL